MSGPQDARGPKAVARFLRPRSVAIIGISTRQGSAGQIILQCLRVNNFKGDIYLVGRTDEPIDGRPVLRVPTNCRKASNSPYSRSRLSRCAKR